MATVVLVMHDDLFQQRRLLQLKELSKMDDDLTAIVELDVMDSDDLNYHNLMQEKQNDVLHLQQC